MQSLFLHTFAASTKRLGGVLWLGILCFVTHASPAESATTVAVGADITASELNAQIASAAPDTVFELAAGTFVFDDTIRLKTGITLRGAGESTVLQANHNQNAIVQLLGQSGGSADVTVENLTLDGSGGQNLYGFQAWGENGPITNVRVAGLTIRDISDTTVDAEGERADQSQFGIFFTDDVTDSVIENNTIHDINTGSVWSAGIRVAKRSSRNTIAGNTVARTGRGGILTNDQSTDLRIVGNTVTKSGLAPGSRDDLGIELFEGGDRSVVEDNVVDSWVSVDKSNQVAVRRNTVTGDPDRDNAFFGLELVDSRDAVFVNNIVQGGVDIGLSFSGPGTTENILVFDNELKNATDFGVQLQGEAGGARKIYLADNTITGTDSNGDTEIGDGVRLNENLTDIVFDRNTITGNTRHAFGVNGQGYTNIDLIDNDTENNGAGFSNRPGELNELDPDQNPAAPMVEIEVGQTLAFTFDRLTGTTEDDSVYVLWDLGVGAPLISEGVLGDSFTQAVPDGLAPDTVLAVVAWDAAGNADFRTAVVVPEPTAAGVLAACGLLYVRARRHASTES